jgi:hypothetical protein
LFVRNVAKPLTNDTETHLSIPALSTQFLTNYLPLWNRELIRIQCAKVLAEILCPASRVEAVATVLTSDNPKCECNEASVVGFSVLCQHVIVEGAKYLFIIGEFADENSVRIRSRQNVVLEKHGEDQLNRSCEKRRSITQSEGGEEYRTYSKKKKG